VADPKVCYRSFVLDNTQPALRAALLRDARRLEISVIDTRLFFCDTARATGLCPPVIGGAIPFLNSWHVDKTYAGMLAGVMGLAFPRG
jgi:hypothetical protein